MDITVNSVLDCPVVMDQHATVMQGSSVEIFLNVENPDLLCGAPPIRYWVVPPAHGELRGAAPNLTYTPAPGYCGADSFAFLVDNGVCFDRATVTIDVTTANTCPMANAQSVNVTENTPLNITLTGTDPDNGVCSPGIQGYALATPPAHGTLSGTPPNVTYTPDTDYNGADSFTFTVTDGQCVSAPAVVSVTVGNANALTELSIVRQGNSLVISWPQTIEGGVLEVTTSLANPITWSDALTQGARVGDVYEAVIPMDGTARWYRLRQP